MRNPINVRSFLTLTGLTASIVFTTNGSLAQQPGGPGQDDPRHGGQGPGGHGPGGHGGQRRPRPGGQGGHDGQRPGGANGQRPGGAGGQGDRSLAPGGNGADDTAPNPAATRELPPGVTRTPVVFSGGHDTDPRDGGRPVVLVASALGVAPEVFREAFSHVRPARAGSELAPEQVRQNKAALMNVLGKYGINNEQLDTASNYYRYVRSRNELWTHRPAVANALVKNGAVIGFEILRGGAGYSSPPTVSASNLRTGKAVVKLAFGRTLATNGSIVSITLAQDKVGSPVD